MKKILCMIGVLLIIAVALLMQIPISEADAASSASGFKMEGSTLVEYVGHASEVTIPDDVKTIGRGAFEDNTKVTKVIVPNSVTKIEEYAFWGCTNLKEVQLGRGLLEISDFSFTNCPALKSVNIPEKVTYIGIMAFADCTRMPTLYIPPNVMNIHETAFDGNYALQLTGTEGTYAAKYIPSFLERQKTFRNYGQPIPEDVVEGVPTPTPTIEPEVIIPDVLEGTLIGSSVVVGNSVLVMTDNTTLEAMTGYPDADLFEEEEEIIYDENGYPIPDDYDDSHMVEIGESVPGWAFYGDNHLKYVYLPNGVKQVEEFAYARSTAETVVLPDGTKTIGYAAFYHCDDLIHIRIPSSVTEIEAKAFEFTPWLNNFFYSKTDSDFLIVGDGILVAYKGNQSVVTLPEGVKRIAAEAFENHAELEEVYLPKSVIDIDESAFDGCVNLKDVHGTNLY